MDEAALKRRTYEFSLSIISLVDQLPSQPSAWVLGKQLIRSATSVGANYRAACRARSKAEFVSKIAISEEEADESMYWLELMRDSELLKPTALRDLIKEANELTAIFTSSGRTAKAGLRPR